jgi:hypothetical protein
MSSLSDAGEFCRSVRGDDKTDDGGEGGYLGSASFLLTPISLLMAVLMKEEWCGRMLRENEWHLLDRCHQAPTVSKRHHH